MTPLAMYFAVAVVTLSATAMWAILARETAVYITSGLSFVGFSWLAIVGADVAMLSPTGELVWMRTTLASIQFIALAMAVVSLVVFGLRLFGAYPSPSQNAAEDEQSANRTTS
jgi:hypothetical protein